ncbi:MAG: nicotinate-nucleotide diphosphorylase (carboxylating), partial [Planctomycetota bacterium]
VLIKDNHLAAAGVATADLGSWLTDVVRPKCVDADGKPLPLEIEVDTLDQFQAVLPARPDIVLLDNIRPDVLRDAVKIRDDSGLPVLLEASGGVNLETVRPIAETGVERISVGALTHSATALDLGFDWAET